MAPFDLAAELADHCTHERRELRRRVLTNGVRIPGYQCLQCSQWSAVPKKNVPELDRLPPYDESLRKQYWDELNGKLREKRAAALAEDRSAWFSEHSRYLRSPQWRSRADRVLRRASFLCEACLLNRATQVHHLTYDHWQNEPLFDLRAICGDCHEEITQTDRARRAGT